MKDGGEVKSLKSGLIWKWIQTSFSQLVSFALTIILARILMPEQYGLIAIVAVFVTFADTLSRTGFASSLIQKKETDKLDFDSMFWLSMAVAGVVYVILYLLAPAVGTFFNQALLCPILRVYALVLFLNALQSILNAHISKRLDFKKQFYATSVGSIIGGAVGVIMAYNGYGVWALVAQVLITPLINVIILSIQLSWYPTLSFSWQRSKNLLAFGTAVIGSNLLRNTCNEIRQFLIAKFYLPAELAIYNRGRSFAGFFYSNLVTTLSSVLFPAIANLNGDLKAAKQLTQKSIQVNCLLISLLMGLLASIAEPLILLLLTEKWIACVPYLQVACAIETISVISTINIQTITGLGRGDWLMKLELKKMPVFLVLLVGGLYINLFAVIISALLYSIYASWMNIRPTKELIGYSAREQYKDLLPPICCALFAFGISLLPSLVIKSTWGLLFINGILFSAVYIIASISLRLPGVSFIVNKFPKLKRLPGLKSF